jgi:hypothetical protein
MAKYLIQVVTQSFVFEAESAEDAEAKYDAYWSQDACPCGTEDCTCLIDEDEEVEHITTKQ